MATRARVAIARSNSPLLQVPGGTKKTERRRSRSRNRQEIESELARKLNEIPMVHDTIEYLLSSYSLIKDSNPLVKESFQRGEDAAFWMRQKTREIITATNLDQPLQQVDSIAAKSFDEMEKRTRKMREEWVENNRAWQTKMNNMSRGIQKQTEGIQYTVFESMQTVMDYIEEMFEKVMVPPTPESAKFAEEPSFKMTFGRMVDITARFNAGIMSLSLQQMKALSDPELWAKATKPHLDPKHLQLRAQIIGQEVSKPPGYALGYMENKSLTALDRQLITSSRALLATSKATLELIGKGPSGMMQMMRDIWGYNQAIIKQLSGAKSMADVTGIGLHETRRALESAQNNMEMLKSSKAIEKTIDWLAVQEKKIQQ